MTYRYEVRELSLYDGYVVTADFMFATDASNHASDMNKLADAGIPCDRKVKYVVVKVKVSSELENDLACPNEAKHAKKGYCLECGYANAKFFGDN